MRCNIDVNENIDQLEHAETSNKSSLRLHEQPKSKQPLFSCCKKKKKKWHPAIGLDPTYANDKDVLFVLSSMEYNWFCPWHRGALEAVYNVILPESSAEVDVEAQADENKPTVAEVGPHWKQIGYFFWRVKNIQIQSKK